MPIILVVNDEDTIPDLITVAFGKKFTVLRGATLEEAWLLFSEHSTENIVLIVMDACVNNREKVDSIPLIKHIRSTYRGAMLAASSHPDGNAKITGYGLCNSEALGGDVISAATEILGHLGY